MTKTDLTRITDISKATEAPTTAEPEASGSLASLPEDMLGTDARTTFFAPDELAPPQSEPPPSDEPSSASVMPSFTDPFGGSEVAARDVSEFPADSTSNDFAPAEVHTATKILNASTPDTVTHQAPASSVQGAAAYPFTLRIDGTLRPHDRSRLQEILTAEKVAVRSVDLEPQFEAGRILLPRISEYVGIAIVQALRDAPVRMWLTPSERSADETLPRPTVPDHVSRMVRTPRSHLSIADMLPLLTGDHADYTPFDAITTSANLNSSFVEATDSPEYSRLVDALSRQLKYQARLKGADAVVRFSLTLVPLSSPQSYKIIASGLAARRK